MRRARRTDGRRTPLPMGVTTVKLASGSDTVIQARSTTALNGDPGCAATQTYTFTFKNRRRPTQATDRPALRHVGDQLGPRPRQPPGDHASADPIGRIIGAIFGGTGATANVVTLDPRPAP